MSRAEGVATLLRLVSRSSGRHLLQPSTEACIAPAAGHARDLCSASTAPSWAAQSAASGQPVSERSHPSEHPVAVPQPWRSASGHSRRFLTGTAAQLSDENTRTGSGRSGLGARQLSAQHTAQRTFSSGAGGEHRQERRQGGGSDNSQRRDQRLENWATEEHRPLDYDEEVDERAAAVQAAFAAEWPSEARATRPGILRSPSSPGATASRSSPKWLFPLRSPLVHGPKWGPLLSSPIGCASPEPDPSWCLTRTLNPS